MRKAFRRHRMDAVFWGLLLFAVLVGGRDAASGFRLAFGLIDFGPPSAEASPSADRAYAVFGHPIGTPSKYEPRVLQPVVAQEFPDWLQRPRAATERTVALSDRAPKIAVVIDDMGQDTEQGRRAITLPAAISLSFLPYPETAPALAREAHREGHEVLVHVPMEPIGTADPGPHALMTGLSAAENLQRLEWDLSRIAGFDGINNHEGSKFTADRAALEPVMSALAERQLFFLDSRTAPNTQVESVARQFGVASSSRDVFLDDTDRPDVIDAQLRATENVARAQGVAIAIGHPRINTLDALWRWCGELRSRGFVLIPVHDAIRLKMDRGQRQASLTH